MAGVTDKGLRMPKKLKMIDANGPSEHCLILLYAAGASSLAPHILLREAGLPLMRERVDLGAKRWRNGDYREITPRPTSRP